MAKAPTTAADTSTADQTTDTVTEPAAEGTETVETTETAETEATAEQVETAASDPAPEAAVGHTVDDNAEALGHAVDDEAVPAANLAAMRHPDGIGCSFAGIAFEPDAKGVIRVPNFAVVELQSHGFEPVKA